MQNYQDKQKNRQIINARSLSLEVTKHKHRLAAQLVSESELLLMFFLVILLLNTLSLNKSTTRKHVCKSSKSHEIANTSLTLYYKINKFLFTKNYALV